MFASPGLVRGDESLVLGLTFTSFEKNLTVGGTGIDVEMLQKWLESSGYLKMPAGVAKGYFGGITQAALIKFQLAQGIVPPVGYFGPTTRAKITELLNQGGSTISLQVLTPNGGEKWKESTNEVISWKTLNPAQFTADAKVDIYLVGKAMFSCSKQIPCPPFWFPDVVLDKNIPLSSAYTWIVGTDIVNKKISPGSYAMKVCVAGTTDCDHSAELFEIVEQGVIETVSPKGGEVWEQFSHKDITWTMVDSTGLPTNAKINISLVDNLPCPPTKTCPAVPIRYYSLDENIPINSTYTWIVGTDINNRTIPAGYYYLNLCVEGTSVCDYGDNAFRITEATSAEVITPSGGERWKIGSTQEVEWELHGEFPEGSVMYISAYGVGSSEDVPSFLIKTYNQIPTETSYRFTVPAEMPEAMPGSGMYDIETGRYKVRITIEDGPGCIDVCMPWQRPPNTVTVGESRNTIRIVR